MFEHVFSLTTPVFLRASTVVIYDKFPPFYSLLFGKAMLYVDKGFSIHTCRCVKGYTQINPLIRKSSCKLHQFTESSTAVR